MPKQKMGAGRKVLRKKPTRRALPRSEFVDCIKSRKEMEESVTFMAKRFGWVLPVLQHVSDERLMKIKARLDAKYRASMKIYCQ